MSDRELLSRIMGLEAQIEVFRIRLSQLSDGLASLNQRTAGQQFVGGLTAAPFNHANTYPDALKAYAVDCEITAGGNNDPHD